MEQNRTTSRQTESTCPQCHRQELMAEAVGEGKVRKSCKGCGFNEVRDQDGRQLLTDDIGPTGAGRQYLVEG